MDFANKAAISTGAASGMGLLFAENFAALGGNVLLCDINEKVLKEKVDAINEKGKGHAIGIRCDVTKYDEVCAVCERAMLEFGRIDVVANFAGGYGPRLRGINSSDYPEFPDIPIEVLDWSLNLNLKGPFYFAHADYALAMVQSNVAYADFAWQARWQVYFTSDQIPSCRASNSVCNGTVFVQCYIKY